MPAHHANHLPNEQPDGPLVNNDERQLTVHVWRGGADGKLQTFKVPARANQTVLDVVTWIQRAADPTLAYRFACRVGMCGSCAMTVNGKPRWTCRSHVGEVIDGDTLTIEPLQNLPVVRDLVTDMEPFFDKWRDARGRYDGSRSRHDPMAPVLPTSKRRQQASAAIECINCAVCYSACDVVSWNSDYLGPAALNRAWAAFNDERDDSRDQIIEAVASDAGCHACHAHQSCAEHCPVGLNPTAGIAGLKRVSLLRMLGSDSDRESGA